MKNVFLSTILLLSTSVSLADRPRSASDGERLLLCTEIDKMMTREEADAGMDMRRCIRRERIKSELISEGVRLITGEINFNYASGYKAKLKCEISYVQIPTANNILSKVICK